MRSLSEAAYTGDITRRFQFSVIPIRLRAGLIRHNRRQTIRSSCDWMMHMPLQPQTVSSHHLHPALLPGDVNAILIRDAPGEDSGAVFSRIRRNLSSSYSPSYVSVIGRHFTLDPVSENIQDIPDILNIISVFVVIAALPAHSTHCSDGHP